MIFHCLYQLTITYLSSSSFIPPLYSILLPFSSFYINTRPTPVVYSFCSSSSCSLLSTILRYSLTFPIILPIPASTSSSSSSSLLLHHPPFTLFIIPFTPSTSDISAFLLLQMVSGAAHPKARLSDASLPLRVPEDVLESPEDLAKNGGTLEVGGERGSLIPHEEEGELEVKENEEEDVRMSLAEGDEDEMLHLEDYDEFEVGHLQGTSRKMNLLDFISTRSWVLNMLLISLFISNALVIC